MDKPLLTQEQMDQEITDAYKRGYKDGYEWLTRADNFRHPSNGGYIPGGPWNYSARTFDPIWFKQRAELSVRVNKVWRNAWIEGINQYVIDNNLDYPNITERL